MVGEVNQKQPLFQEVMKRFQASGMKLTKMVEVERSSDVDLFEQEKRIMLEHLKMRAGDDTKADDLRILDLYHGTSESSEQILNEGFDVRTLKHFGHFGRGIYFSDDPAFARVEAESMGGSKVIYRCKVILGNSKVYPPEEVDPSLMREPRELIDGKMVAYDSVEGNISGFTQFAVYERRRILIQHVLSYEADGPPPVLLSLPQRPGKSDATSDQSASGDDDASNSSSSYSTPVEDEGALEEKKKKKTKKRKKTKDPNGVIISAFNYLMNLRGFQPQTVFDELLTLFYRTYIQRPEGNSRSKVRPEVNAEIIDHLTKEFCDFTECTNEIEAKIFLDINEYDLNNAVVNYLKYFTVQK